MPRLPMLPIPVGRCIAARATVRYNHAHPGNRLDRLLLGRNHGHLGVAPGIGGVTITWTNARSH